MEQKTHVAVFGGGCFWCTEAVFQMLKGVVSVMPGYAGGTKENPAYEKICSGATGYVEVSRVEYDPEKITFRDLLRQQSRKSVLRNHYQSKVAEGAGKIWRVAQKLDHT